MQRKTLTRPFEIKSLDDDGSFSGYASVFGNVDSYGDAVQKGAFTKTLTEWKAKGELPAMLWAHQHNEPIGIYTAMREDDHGLVVEGKLLIDGDPLAKRAYSHLKMGSLRGLSIGYSIPKDGSEYDSTAKVLRLNEINLMEVSLVVFPANESAQVTGVKSAFESVRALETFLRDAGLSKNQACALISKGGAGLVQGAGGGHGEHENQQREPEGLAELGAEIKGLVAQLSKSN